MSQSLLHHEDGGPVVAETLPLSCPSHDDSHLDELREHVHHLRRILPVISISAMALHARDADSDCEIASVLRHHPCDPMNSEIEPYRRAASVVQVASPEARGSSMNQQQLAPVLKRCSKPRQLTVGYASTNTRGVDVPYLRLRGLQDAGFLDPPAGEDRDQRGKNDNRADKVALLPPSAPDLCDPASGGPLCTVG